MTLAIILHVCCAMCRCAAITRLNPKYRSNSAYDREEVDQKGLI